MEIAPATRVRLKEVPKKRAIVISVAIGASEWQSMLGHGRSRTLWQDEIASQWKLRTTENFWAAF